MLNSHVPVFRELPARLCVCSVCNTWKVTNARCIRTQMHDVKAQKCKRFIHTNARYVRAAWSVRKQMHKTYARKCTGCTHTSAQCAYTQMHEVYAYMNTDKFTSHKRNIQVWIRIKLWAHAAIHRACHSACAYIRMCVIEIQQMFTVTERHA